MQFIAIILAFFGLVVVALGIKRFREIEIEIKDKFQALEADAEKSVEEIEEHTERSKVRLQEITSTDISDPVKTMAVDEAIRDVRSGTEASFIAKMIIATQWAG